MYKIVDKAICLGLDKRKNMWQSLSDQVKKYFDIELDIFIAGDGSDYALTYNHIDTDILGNDFTFNRTKGHYNAYLCHKKIFKSAYENNVERLLFLEDDAYLIEERIHILQDDRILKIINKTHWHIIYLGWWMIRNGYENPDREDIEETWEKHGLYHIEIIPTKPFLRTECSGLHGVIINRELLPILAEAEFGPIDCFLHQKIFKHPDFIGYYICPKVIHQKSCWSYCDNIMSNRKELK